MNSMNESDIQSYIAEMPDEVLATMAFSMPWQAGGVVDGDGAPYVKGDPDRGTAGTGANQVYALQAACREKYATNPQVNTSIDDMAGRLTGNAFEVSSEIEEIQDKIEEIAEDDRNQFPIMMPKYVKRARIEGELFLVCTVHESGFIEVDFREAYTVRGIGKHGCGIVFHPTKPQMPLFYQFQADETDAANGEVSAAEQIPSIYAAKYPELIDMMHKHREFSHEKAKNHKKAGAKFKPFKGYFRFVVQWDMGCITERNVSQVRTTLEWINHYENLKKYEIDHKRSSGAYLWTFSFDDARAFKQWMMLSKEERAKTGIMAKKMPGGTLVLPPGMKCQVQNPQLPKISDSDTDILQMVISGLNSSEDIVMGSNKGTYASAKANRGPMTDRVSNETAHFERFLRYYLWDSIFFLSSMVSSFKYEYKVKEAVSWKDQKPVIKNKTRKACKLIDITFPSSEVADIEASARGLLGVKHGSLNATMGIPNRILAKKMGFASYGRLRLQAAMEAEEYPELQPDVDASASTQEGAQEKIKGSGEAQKPGKAQVVKRAEGTPKK